MRLNKEVVDKLRKERGLSIDDLARLYKGSEQEYWVMCHIKCGFNRAYQIAEIFNCTVDDIVIYSEDKWPRWHRPEDDGRTSAGRARVKREKERKEKEKNKRNE